MDPDQGIPGLGTYTAAGWGGGYSPATYTPPSAEAQAAPASPSQVPGTSGAPGGYTPAATPGGVSSGGGTGTASSSWGSLAGLLGLSGAARGATPGGGMTPRQGLSFAQLGLRMLGPPGSPLAPGAPAPTLSNAGGNPMIAQFQQMFGVDYNTALQMMLRLRPGGTAMTPGQQAQNIFPSSAFNPPATPPVASPLLPSASIATAQNPYGVPRGGTSPTAMLPPLGQGAFMPGSAQPPSLSSQMLYGSIA